MKIKGFNDTHNPLLPDDLWGKELKWFPSDSEENYNPVNNTYGPNDISYKFNNHGFRSDEFDSSYDKTVLFLGCSMTCGIGLPLEHTWSHIILELIKKDVGYHIPYYNLAVGGSGLDTQTRFYYHYGLKIKPRIVLAYFPDYRRELYPDNFVETRFHSFSQPIYNFDNMHYLVDERIIKYETEKNLCFLDTMLKLNKTRMVYNTWAANDYDIYHSIQTKHDIHLVNDFQARDKIHPSYKENLKFAHAIYEQYKNDILDSLKD